MAGAREDSCFPAGYDNAGLPATAVRAPLWRPVNRPNAVRWSETNLLAVATGDAVSILSAADLSEGPRGTAGPFKSSLKASMPSRVQCAPRDHQRNLAYSLERTVDCSSQRDTVRDLAWSPPVWGLHSLAATAPCCLLAVCTSTSQVRLSELHYLALLEEARLLFRLLVHESVRA